MKTRLSAHTGPVRYVAIEVSSTKIRLQCHGVDGHLQWQKHIPQKTTVSTEGRFQQPSTWLSAVETLVNSAKSAGMDFTATLAIGVCATTPTLIAVDDHNMALDDAARMWADTNRVGCVNSKATNTGLMKMAYLVRSEIERDRFRRASYYVDAGPYIACQLTGTLVSGAAMLSQKFSWSVDGFDLTGLELLDDGEVDAVLSRIPSKVVNTGEIVGLLNSDWSEKLGAKTPPAVILCGYDSVAGVFGANVWNPSSNVVFSVGTSATIYRCVSGDKQDGDIGPWSPVPHILPGCHKLISGGFEAGVQSIELLHEDLRLTCRANKDTELERLAESGERLCSSKCLSLPFGGVPLRAPLNGVVLPTVVSCESAVPRREVSLTAMRRGIACFFNYCLQDLTQYGEETTCVHIVGGGTQSPSFCQLVADITRLPVRRFNGSTAANGAALMAIRAVCGEQQAGEAAFALEAATQIVSPCDDPRRQEFYAQLFTNFNHRLRSELALTKTSFVQTH